MELINHFLPSYGYLAVFIFVALESVGSPLPGETAVIAAALYAGSTHRLNIGLIALVAAVAAVAGDNGGYWLGQHGGSRLVRRYGHWVRLDARKLKVGRYLFARHGGKIVFLGRLSTSLRPYAAFFAGLNAMRRSRFLVVNAAAGVLWAAACSFGAYALGSAAIRVGSALTIGGLAVAGLLTIVVALVMYRTMRRFEEPAAAAFPDPPPIRHAATEITPPGLAPQPATTAGSLHNANFCINTRHRQRRQPIQRGERGVGWHSRTHSLLTSCSRCAPHSSLPVNLFRDPNVMMPAWRRWRLLPATASLVPGSMDTAR